MIKITIYTTSDFEIEIFRSGDCRLEEVEAEFSVIGDENTKSLTFKDDDGKSSTTLINEHISHYRIEKQE